MFFESLKAEKSSKTVRSLPVIEESSEKQEDKRKKKKTACAKALLNPKISFPELKSQGHISFRSEVKSTSFSNESALLNSLKCVENIQGLMEEKDFKSCSNIFGPSECQLLFKVPSSEINDTDFEFEEEKLTESNALKRWEFWMKDKIRLQDYFGKHLGKNPCDLLHHESDKFREIVEEKSLLVYSQVPDADKWRGHPYRWNTPSFLSEKKKPDCDLENSPQYCAVKSKLEKGEIPEMEFVGVPKAIQKEKGLLCKSEKSPMKDWEKMSYRKERISHFMKQRKRLKPHDIQMDELAIVGKKIPQKKKENKAPDLAKKVPEIYVTADDEEPRDTDYRQSIFCLAVQGEETKYEIGADDCQGSGKVFNWQIDFGVNTVGSLVEKVLRVENRGTMAVRYDWLSKNVERNFSLDPLQAKRHEPWFFFDKNPGICFQRSLSYLTLKSTATRAQRRVSRPGGYTLGQSNCRLICTKQQEIDQALGETCSRRSKPNKRLWIFRECQNILKSEIIWHLHMEPMMGANVANQGFFLPGQIYDLKFYYCARYSGIRKEVWHLKTKPPLSQNRGIGTVVLSAITTEELSDETCALKSYLKRRVRDSAVDFAIEKLLYNVFSFSRGLREIEYRSIFRERELFEYHNPKHYYHSKIVRELKELFQEIPFKNQTDWDLSLDNLIDLIKTYKNGKERNSSLLKVAGKAQKLLRPNYVSKDVGERNKKYRMTFEILCRMINFAEEDCNYIRNSVLQKTEQQLGEKTLSDTESAELLSNCSSKSEEINGSKSAQVGLDVKPRSLIFFHMMFYLKMYQRVCEAVEQIAGVLETNKLFQPYSSLTINWKNHLE